MALLMVNRMMKHSVKFLLFSGLLFTFFLTQGSFAQDAPKPGLRHMDVTSTKPAPSPAPSTGQAEKPAAIPSGTEAIRPKTLKPGEAVKKLEDLSQWPYLTDLMTPNSPKAIDDAIHKIQLDPGSVPPRALFYAAKALADQKKMADAAFYFYFAQLRATFDMARFPPYNPEDEKPKIKDSRTEDQRGQTAARTVKLVNPHESLSMLALSIGQPISKWAMQDPERLKSVMAQVRDFDLIIPYAYLPDYDTSHARPFKEWPALLDKTRDTYFTRVNQIANGLTTIRPSEPTPSFPRN